MYAACKLGNNLVLKIWGDPVSCWLSIQSVKHQSFPLLKLCYTFMPFMASTEHINFASEWTQKVKVNYLHYQFIFYTKLAHLRQTMLSMVFFFFTKLTVLQNSYTVMYMYCIARTKLFKNYQ
jgi:hypothetical protein